MSYRQKKYVYIATGGYYGRFTIGVYATKKAAVEAAKKWTQETDVEAWVERHTIMQSSDEKEDVKKYV